MEGIFIKREKHDFLNDNRNDLLPLLEQNGIEITLQTLNKNSQMWFTPSANNVEFFYIVEGSATLVTKDGAVELKENDCFYTKKLKSKIMLRSNTDLKILCVSTCPVFNHIDNFCDELNYLIDKITEKDEYTKQHCKRVADYCLFLSRKLKCSEEMFDNLVVASLFHDVGKCLIPDEILQKRGRLSKDEFDEIKKHPGYTKNLLTGKFSDEIIKIASEHHERLDGSGYPYGLSGNQLTLEVKIIAVADSFDAMTTVRPYNRLKSFREAADELYAQKDKYDQNVTRALKEMVESGELEKRLEEVEKRKNKINIA